MPCAQRAEQRAVAADVHDRVEASEVERVE